jgi:hypothetical protein
MRGAIVFSGSSHPKLAEGVCDRLGMKPGSATLSKFKNGETSVTIRMERSTRLLPRLPADGLQTRRSETRTSSSSRAGARSALRACKLRHPPTANRL